MIVNTSAQSAAYISPETAAAFGLSADATPDDVLNILKAGVLHKATGEYTKLSTVGALPVGATLSLNVNGEAREFLVVHQGKPSDIYDDSCDGTWLLMKDIYEKRSWGTGMNKYETSDIHSYLNSTFLNLFDANIRDTIKQVKIPYRKNGGGYDNTAESGANGLSCKVFLLSGYEVGFTNNDSGYFPIDGAKLAYFKNGTGELGKERRIAYLNDSAFDWWLRSPCTGSGDTLSVTKVSNTGFYSSSSLESSYGIRPALVLPSDFSCEVYADSNGNFYPEQKYNTTLSDVLGNVLSVGPKIAVGSYVGTGTYGATTPNSLMFDFAPKMVMVFQTHTRNINSGGNLLSSDAWSCYFVQNTDLLTTDYVGGRGFGAHFNGYPYGKKSADGKTLYWYHERGGEYQANESEVTYSYIAIS